MGFSFTGHVLRSAQVATSNASTTGTPDTGVVRDVRPVPPAYTLAADAPDFVDTAADQYRVAVLEAPGTTSTEYLVWAANTANLAGPADADPSWWSEDGYGFIPSGTATVGVYKDGSAKVFVRDNGNRDIGRIYAVVVARGDVTDYDDNGWVNPDDVDPASYPGGQPRKGDNPYITLYFGEDSQDPHLGSATLSDVQLALLGGGLSVERGDTIITVHYTVGSARFWWTRNDRYETRFGWNPQLRKWAPYKGSSPKNLGRLEFDVIYQMAPEVRNLPIGAFLPGSATDLDDYGMIRVGTTPGASASTPVPGIQVKADEDVAQGYDFSLSPGLNGVVGQSSGKLIFNPTFVELNAGKTIWYVYKGFQADATGVIGKMTDPHLFLTPVPGPTDYPLIRFGSRAYLRVTVAATDAELEALPIPTAGTCIVSSSTGRLRLSSADVAKATTTSLFFSKHFLGEDVVYDGVSLSGALQPTRAPVQLLDGNGDPAVAISSSLYLPAFQYLPTEFAASDNRRGLGRSGVLDAPDGTGALPVAGAASVRPGGDNTVDAATGRVRQVLDGVSDAFLFTQLGVISNLKVVDYDSELPNAYAVPAGTAYVSRQLGAHGSRVVLSPTDQSAFGSKAIYFLQAAFNPAVYETKARLLSRNRDIFRFTGDEVLRYAIDGVAYTWLASSLPVQSFYTPDEVADSINLVSPGRASTLNGRVVLSSGNATGTVEIGFGVGGTKDLSGAAALGFLPGWRVRGGVDNWLADSGVTLGLARNPLNLDGTAGIPDFRAKDRVQNEVLTDNIQGIPFQFLSVVPLQDEVGYDEGVFFTLATTVMDEETPLVLYQALEHYENIIHRFGQRKFDWVEEGFVTTRVDTAAISLNLGASGIAPESLEPAVGGGLYVSADGTSFVQYKQGEDYLLPQDGLLGTAVLVEKFLALRATGAGGSLVAGNPLFTDGLADFTSAQVGDLLVVEGAAYTVTEVVNTTTLRISPTPTVTSSRPMQWELRAGYADSVYNPALVADMGYMDFNHLPQESMVIRVLTPVPADTLRANLSGALASGREISLRFGLAAATSGNVASLTGLQQVELGALANDILAVPTPSSIRFSTASFSIKIGAQVFQQGAGLEGVATFSSDPAGIEYLTTDAVIDGVVKSKGSLKFGSSILADHRASTVYYVEEFLPAASLSAGFAEYDPTTGNLRLSLADATNHAGKQVYLVERLITERRKDVSINPILGAFSTNVPLPIGSSVEVSYWLADLEGRKVGNQITEFLPVFVRDEIATRTKQNTYVFNAQRKHTINDSVEPIVYIGPILQNFGRLDYVVDYPSELDGQGRITFVSRVLPDNVQVKVTYGVLDLLGGERAFEVSKKPVYRPPFFIKAGQDRFGLRGNRLAEFAPGQMLRIGSDCFYIKSLRYYTTENVTAVTIFPPTVREVGSRAPGNDVLTVISATPITTVVDPDGAEPVQTTAPAGFMSVIDLASFPFEPVSRGQSEVVFNGDLTQFAVTGHLLEVGGCPFTIASSELSADGSRTTITVTAAFWKGFAVKDAPTVKLSYRPVYPPDATNFLGVGSFLDTEEFRLFQFPLGSTGRELVRDVDFAAEADSGAITLKAGVSPGDKLFAAFTKLKPLQPYMRNGTPVIPKFQATYRAQQYPSEANGILGGTLRGMYSYANPDSFYFRAVKLTSFLGEIVQEAVQEITSRLPASGVPLLLDSSSKNWEHGRFGLKGERRHLLDKDRAARTFLDFYNNVVTAFEQVEETLSGGFIGDRDGKFRFWVGHGKDFPTPGYEDDITGYLTPRNVWTDVVNGENPAALYTGLESDWVVTPSTLTVVNGQVQGTLLDSEAFGRLVGKQSGLVHNDVDDLVLTGIGSTSASFAASSPYFLVKAQGKFQTMGKEHKLSRLFPTVTEAFVRTMPGIGYDPTAGDPGVYTAGKAVAGQSASTAGTEIAQLRNPVLGAIQNVQTATLHARRARARIWRYCPEGIPAHALGTNKPPAAITSPCIIAVSALLRDVPIRPDTGYPDSAKLLSQGGSVSDAAAGDPSLIVPGFAAGDAIVWGKPDGTVYPAFNASDPKTIYGVGTYTGIFVKEVLYGCVITLADVDGVQITTSAAILAGTVTAEQLPVEQGDTVFVGPSKDLFTSTPDLTKFATFQTLTSGFDTYRDGFDVKVTPDGKLVDITLPSSGDGSFLALKEMFGQNAPRPLAALEGPVDFTRGAQNPLLIPALSGDVQDDSGDYQIPYLQTDNSELDRFDQASAGLSTVISTVDPLGHAVYPDEVLGDDGAIVTTAGSYPATLTTVEDVSPGFGPGKGNLRTYDLLFIQANGNPLGNLGALGIHSVGAVTAGVTALIETPRFVTATKAPAAGSTDTGDPICYTLANAMVFVQGPYPAQPQAELTPPPGVVITEDVPNGVTILDFGSTTITLNDGQTVATGNLNDILAADPSNKITLRLIARRDTDIQNGPAGPNPLPSSGAGGVVALTIEFQGLNVTVTDYQGNVLAGLALPVFGTKVPADPSVPANRQIRIPLTGVIPWGPGPGTEAQWFLPHTAAAGPVYSMLYGFEFAFDLDTRNPGFSRTAWIADDRLTFYEVCDLSFAKKRGYIHPQSGLALATELAVYEVTVGNTAGTTIRSSVNRYINGLNGVNPIPLTFVPRTDADTVGYWEPRSGATTERGRLKAMAFEGHGNATFSGADVTFAAAVSNEKDTTGDIFSGTGKTASRFNSLLTSTARWDHRVAEITVAAGSASQVLPGDVLVINGSANAAHPGTHHAGTYIVRHAVDASLGKPYLKTSPETVAGAETGWCPLHFPTVVSMVGNTLTISDLAPAPGGPLVGGQPCGFPTPGVSTRIYVVRDVSALASSDPNVFKYAVISAKYTAIALGAGDTGVFTIDPLDCTDASGVNIPVGDFLTKATDGTYQVSGMTFWPVNVSGAKYGLPENNCVGFDSDSDTAAPPVPPPPLTEWAVYGFHLITLIPPKPLLDAGAPAVSQTFTGDNPGAVPGQYIRKASADHVMVPILGTVVGSHTFQANLQSPVYDWVATGLDVTGLKNSDWNPLNIPGGAASLVDCILPGTTLLLGDGANDGFYAQSGVFLEPSVPRACLDMVVNYARVVDATHSLPDPTLAADDWDREIGMRDSEDYRLSGAAVNAPDEVTFEVRRIRRFHEVNEVADRNLHPLRFAYEIRRGRITAYASNVKQGGTLTAAGFTMNWETTKPPAAPKAPDVWNDGGIYNGTNLGPFTDPDVNVHAGDTLRLLDENGNLVEESKIAAVQDGTTLILAAPGLTTAGLVGMRFEVYLKTAPVPQEQSCEELLALLTDKEVSRTDADWVNQKGGYVPDMTTGTSYANAVNRLYDDLNAPGNGQTFGALGVKKGDIIIVDPAGTIPQDGGLPEPQEKGTRSLGDKGVPSRVAGVYVAGSPSPLDDNRGFYRVKRVVDSANPPYLLVDPLNTFAGAEDDPEVFGSGTYAYAVYPTVTDSPLKKAPYPVLASKTEGQMDLRPTRKRDAVTKSFSNRGDAFGGHSMRPFSYRVIRPSKLFSAKALDLVLMMRERILSLIELLQRAMAEVKSGSYFVFQRDEHIKELGSPTDPGLGLGVPSNLYIEAVGGRMDVVPYANNSGSLSILDRRVWAHDSRLDSLTTNGFGGMKMSAPGDTTYTAYTVSPGSSVLPVLPERIEEILESKDKFRPVRYVWLAYRTHKVLGTLAAIEQYDRELPDRLEEQRKLPLLEGSAENV